MSDELITLLQRHDPAAALRPLPGIEAAAMRDRIVGSAPRSNARAPPVAAAGPRGGRGRDGARRCHRRLLIHRRGRSRPTVNQQFAAVTRTIALPPGAHWKALDLPADALYGQHFALMAAIGQAQCAWYGHWDAAASAGNSAAVAQSYAAALKLRALMPVHPAGASEDAGGYDAGSLAAADREIAAAHRGDFTLLRQDLKANCGA